MRVCIRGVASAWHVVRKKQTTCTNDTLRILVLASCTLRSSTSFVFWFLRVARCAALHASYFVMYICFDLLWSYRRQGCGIRNRIWTLLSPIRINYAHSKIAFFSGHMWVWLTTYWISCYTHWISAFMFVCCFFVLHKKVISDILIRNVRNGPRF